MSSLGGRGSARRRSKQRPRYDENYINSLLGEAGHKDVEDCEKWSQHVRERLGILHKPIVVSGGSHGGFLTAHLIGRAQLPGIVGGVMRNPVTDLEAMLKQTDIPEWVLLRAACTGFRFDMASCGLFCISH